MLYQFQINWFCDYLRFFVSYIASAKEEKIIPLFVP